MSKDKNGSIISQSTLWIIIAGIITVTGFAFMILAAIFFLFNNEGLVRCSENYNTYGTFIGGLVGSLFTLAGIIVLIITLRKHDNQFNKQYKQVNAIRIEDVFYKMIDNFYRYVDYLESKLIPGKINNLNGDIKLEGEMIIEDLQVFKHYSNKFTQFYRKSTIDESKEKFKDAKSCFDSKFKIVFKNIDYILSYIDKNKNNLDDPEFYNEYFIDLIDGYIKFIIALYKIYENDNLSKKLIEKYGIISDDDFNNYIKDEGKRKNFFERMNTFQKIVNNKANNKNTEEDQDKSNS